MAKAFARLAFNLSDSRDFWDFQSFQSMENQESDHRHKKGGSYAIFLGPYAIFSVEIP